MRRNDWRTCRTAARAGVIALLLIGCDSVEPVEPEQPLVGLRLVARSETSLTGTVGTRIDSGPVVQVTTLDGNPAPGREVRFLVSGGGSIESASQRTDTAGMASPGTWTLGTTIRPQAVTAHAEGVDDPIVFRAAVEAGRPATMAIVAGNHQTAEVGAPLQTPLQVKLADQYGNPVPEEPVTFTVTLGNGSVVGNSAETGAHGVAQSGIWTLGGIGAQLVSASAAGKTVLFDAFACGVPCRGQELVFTWEGSLFSLVNGVQTLLTSEAPSDPAWSPDGQRIASVTYDDWDETYALYVMDADGSNSALLAYDFHSPSWSPDGRQLAVSGYAGVYTMSVEPDGTPPVLLAETAQSPAWSPDGTRIAFVENSGLPSVNQSLNVMNANGSAVTTLVPGDGSGVGRATWSPDGRRLAFIKCRASACNVFAVNADGTGLAQLTFVNDARSPAWSPEGTRIAFSSNYDIYWVPPDGPYTQPILMVRGGYSPAWRP